MKELQHFKQDAKEIVAPAKKEFKIIGSLKRGDGHTVYKYNIAKDEITPVIYSDSYYNYWGVLRGDYSVRHRINVEENCLYTSALNIENAERKFKQQLRFIIRSALQL